MKNKDKKFYFDLRVIYKEMQRVCYDSYMAMPDDGTSVKAMIADVLEGHNGARINELISLALAEFSELLHPYIEDVGEPFAYTDRVDDITQPINLRLSVPESMSETTLKLLYNLGYEYIIARVLYDYTININHNVASIWLAKYEKAKQDIILAKSIRKTPIRRRCNPF